MIKAKILPIGTIITNPANNDNGCYLIIGTDYVFPNSDNIHYILIDLYTDKIHKIGSRNGIDSFSLQSHQTRWEIVRGKR